MAAKNTAASGSLYSSSIPNLIGGVSQQPWNVRMPTQAADMVNCHATITEFMRRRPAFSHVSQIESPDGSSSFTTYAINKSSEERYIVMVGMGGIKVYDLEGNAQAVSMTEDTKKYLSTATNPSEDIRFCSIKDYLFIVNRKVLTQRGVTSSIFTRSPECVVFVRQASYDTTYEVVLDGAKYSYKTPSATYEVGTTPPSISANGICNQLKSKIPSTFNVVVSGPIMWIRKSDNTEFTFNVSASRSSHIIVYRDQITNVNKLSVYAPNGMIIRVTQSETTELDDYYVKFVTNGGASIGEGSWQETAAPSQTSSFDNATMPHALIRRKANIFSFEEIDWAERTSGDDNTNPFPSFTGKGITDILFYRNRLCFLCQDNIIMSQTNNFFNFFNGSATASSDADPIDVAASGTKNTTMYGYAIYSGGLILFSTKGQFLLEHDTVLSNKTVSLTPVTEYESTDKVSPVSSGKTIFFALDRGKYLGIKEYLAFDSDNTSSNNAVDVTSHVPHYILGSVTGMECNTNEDILFIRSSSDESILYVYKYYWDGNNKAQSSWYKWKLTGTIHGIHCFDTDTYCIMQHPDGWFLERFSLEPKHKDEGEDFEFCLDRKFNEELMTIDDSKYDPISKTSEIEIPFYSENGVIVTRSGGDIPAGKILDVVSYNGTKVVVKGRITHNTRLMYGIPYESSYVFTTLSLRNQNNTAITNGRLQIRNLYINVDDTGYMEATVKPVGKLESRYIFTGKRLGGSSATIGDIPLYTGKIAVPVLSKNDTTDIIITSDSYLPFALINAAWEGFYTTRNQRV